jgi:2-polyprenyl-3-methyl-5-hydroxy-6-metoxy-1,4-benzoquinol methylase
MAERACRVCGGRLFDEPLARYANMPKSAQELPDAAALADETGVDLEVFQCAACGLVQLVSEPVPYYREVIRAAAVSDVVRRAKSEQFARFIDEHGLYGKRIVEVGCGRGEFLSLLGRLDVEAFGLEASVSAVADCVASGLRVTRGYPGEGAGAWEDGPFDGFLLLMFLEHMPEPGAALRAIADNLVDGAVGLIEVPNFDMVVRKTLFSEFVGDHLLYFTAATLRTTLQINGFDVLRVDELRDGYVLSAIVRKRDRSDISGFREQQQQLTTELQAYLAGFGARRVAVWGAGHQAFATIAMTGIAREIRYVVDSAPFKQGRFTPATHLPIVAPEALRTDPVDAVIVMAASYSDEVAGIVREQLGSGLSVVILRENRLERA